jgi:hypothetical protein
MNHQPRMKPDPAAMPKRAMIEVDLHFHGQGIDRRRLAVVPCPGWYLRDSLELWKVADVVVDRGRIRAYLTRVSELLWSDLETAWSDWAKPLRDDGDTEDQDEDCETP